MGLETVVVIIILLVVLGPGRSRFGDGPYYDPATLLLILVLAVLLMRGHLF